MGARLSRGGVPAFGAHAFTWAGGWSRGGAEREISGAASAGLEFVEIPLLDPEGMDVEHTRSLLEDHGLARACSLGLPREAHLPSNPEGAARFLDGAVETTDALVGDGLSFPHHQRRGARGHRMTRSRLARQGVL